jgi:hypothetical protein
MAGDGGRFRGKTGSSLPTAKVTRLTQGGFRYSQKHRGDLTSQLPTNRSKALE